MSIFEVDNNVNKLATVGRNFGSIQALQKKHEEAEAKKAQEKIIILKMTSFYKTN